MACGTKEQKQAAEIGDEFPYRHLMKHPAWAAVNRAVEELESNSDLELQTARQYVVGYLVQQLVENGLIAASDVGTAKINGRHAPLSRIKKLHSVR